MHTHTHTHTHTHIYASFFICWWTLRLLPYLAILTWVLWLYIAPYCLKYWRPETPNTSERNCAHFLSSVISLMSSGRLHWVYIPSACCWVTGHESQLVKGECLCWAPLEATESPSSHGFWRESLLDPQQMETSRWDVHSTLSCLRHLYRGWQNGHWPLTMPHAVKWAQMHSPPKYDIAQIIKLHRFFPSGW